jgi:hypothetical protein
MADTDYLSDSTDVDETDSFEFDFDENNPIFDHPWIKNGKTLIADFYRLGIRNVGNRILNHRKSFVNNAIDLTKLKLAVKDWNEILNPFRIKLHDQFKEMNAFRDTDVFFELVRDELFQYYQKFFITVLRKHIDRCVKHWVWPNNIIVKDSSEAFPVPDTFTITNSDLVDVRELNYANTLFPVREIKFPASIILSYPEMLYYALSGPPALPPVNWIKDIEAMTFDDRVTDISGLKYICSPNYELDASSLQSVIFPAALERIPDSLFQDRETLRTIEFPSTSRLVRIGENAFEGCKITSIELPSTLKSIGNSAFSFCNFSTLKIPHSCYDIGESAFSIAGDNINDNWDMLDWPRIQQDGSRPGLKSVSFENIADNGKNYNEREDRSSILRECSFQLCPDKDITIRLHPQVVFVNDAFVNVSKYRVTVQHPVGCIIKQTDLNTYSEIEGAVNVVYEPYPTPNTEIISRIPYTDSTHHEQVAIVGKLTDVNAANADYFCEPEDFVSYESIETGDIVVSSFPGKCIKGSTYKQNKSDTDIARKPYDGVLFIDNNKRGEIVENITAASRTYTDNAAGEGSNKRMRLE